MLGRFTNTFDYIARKTARFASNLTMFVQQCLRSKKIVVISDKGISSIPISSRSQLSVISSFMIFMLWVSYSTGKYFAYEDIISEKDREIWTTHETNENLQYQVSGLHGNLLELNTYFDNIKKYNQISAMQSKGKVADSEEKSESESVDSEKQASINSQMEKDTDSVKNVLKNIHSKIIERADGLEVIIGMTGLEFEDVAKNNDFLKKAYDASSSSTANQGGEYIPFDSGFNQAVFEADVNYLMQLEKIIHSFPLTSPMKKYWMSSGFGHRVDPMHKRSAMHSGIDLVGPIKAEVLAPAPGIVKHAGRKGAYGNFIEVEHSSGLTTRYGHLSKIYVKKGEKVARGDIIALQGNTGRSTGSHLHYEVRHNNIAINPSKFLKAGEYVF